MQVALRLCMLRGILLGGTIFGTLMYTQTSTYQVPGEAVVTEADTGGGADLTFAGQSVGAELKVPV